MGYKRLTRLKYTGTQAHKISDRTILSEHLRSYPHKNRILHKRMHHTYTMYQIYSKIQPYIPSTTSIMKILLILLFGPITFISASELRIPALQSSLARTLATDEPSPCQLDMWELQLNTELSDSFQKSINTFSLDFDARPLDYCARKQINTGQGQMGIVECTVNYGDFSSRFQQICMDSEGEIFPVTLFMHCSSDDSELEMEIANIPSCVAHTCEKSQIDKAMGRLLESADISDGNGNISCGAPYHRSVNAPRSFMPTSAGDRRRYAGDLAIIFMAGVTLWFHANS